MRFIFLFGTVACVWSGCKETPEATSAISPQTIVSTEAATSRPENVLRNQAGRPGKAVPNSGRVRKPPAMPHAPVSVVVGRATVSARGVEPPTGGVRTVELEPTTDVSDEGYDDEIVQALIDSWEEQVKYILSQGLSGEEVRVHVKDVTDDVVASIEARDSSGKWNDVIGNVVQRASDVLDAFNGESVAVVPRAPGPEVPGSAAQVDDEEIVQALVDSWEEQVKYIQSQGLSREEVLAHVKAVTDDVVASIETRDSSGKWNGVIGNVVQRASDLLEALSDPCLDRIARAAEMFKTRVEPRAVRAVVLTGRPRVVSGYAFYGLDAELLRVMRDFNSSRECRRDFDGQVDGWKASLNEVIGFATEVRRNVYTMFGDLVHTKPAADSVASAGERSDEIFAAVESLELQTRTLIASLETHASAALLQPLVESLESFATEQIGRLRLAADKMRGVVAQRSLEGYVVQANRVLVPLAQVFAATRAASTQKGAEAYAAKILRANPQVWPRVKQFEAGFLAQVTADLVKHIPTTLPEPLWRAVLGSVQEANRFKALYESKTV